MPMATTVGRATASLALLGLTGLSAAQRALQDTFSVDAAAQVISIPAPASGNPNGGGPTVQFNVAGGAARGRGQVTANGNTVTGFGEFSAPGLNVAGSTSVELTGQFDAAIPISGSTAPRADSSSATTVISIGGNRGGVYNRLPQCEVGYTRRGRTCVDVNECTVSVPGPCSVFADCTNSPGSFRCTCRTGYTGNGTTCVLIPPPPPAPAPAPATTRRSCVGPDGKTQRHNTLRLSPDRCSRCRCTNGKLKCTPTSSGYCETPDPSPGPILPPATTTLPVPATTTLPVPTTTNLPVPTTTTLPVPTTTTVPSPTSAPTPGPASKSDNYLYVWYGDADQKDADFIATLDFNRTSPTYGKVISTAPVTGNFSRGNEPHHIGLSGDGKTLLGGGLLSWIVDQPDLFLFDISNPRQPVFTRAIDAPLSSATDDFINLPNGNMLITMMGGIKGGVRGRVLELDTNNTIVGEWPTNAPEDLTPHGISVRVDRNLMITSDFVVPASTLANSTFGGPQFRQSMRVWDLANRTIVRTIVIPTSGAMMDLTLIPNDSLARGYCPSQGGTLFLLNTNDGTYESVLDFNQLARPAAANATTKPTSTPHILRFRTDGKRAFMTMYEAGKVAMLNTTDPRRPTIMKVVDLGATSGPHFLTLTNDESRMIVTDYFLVNTEYGGLVNADGDRKTHVFLLSEDDISLDPLWAHDGNSFTTGPARPHGVVAVAR